MPRKELTLGGFRDALLKTVSTTVMIYFIIGASVFSPFLALTHTPDALVDMLVAAQLHPLVLLLPVLAVFIFLGTFLDGFATMVLALPIVLPLIEIYRGIMPFWLAMLVCLIVIIALPQLSLYLPFSMRN